MTRRASVVAGIAAAVALCASLALRAEQGRGAPPPPTPTLGLEHGTLDFDTPDFTLKLVKDSQTIAALQPKGAKSVDPAAPFDFTPADQLPARQGNGFNQLGDITLRVKTAGLHGGAWMDLSSSSARKPLDSTTSTNLDLLAPPAGWRRLAAADLTPTLPADAPVHVIRSWLVDPAGRLVMQFEIANQSDAPVTIGGLGFPVVFNNMIQNFTTNRARTLPQAHEICSFFDPYMGEDAGYLQVTRLSGAGPALVVVPAPGTHTPFEAYRPLDDASHRSQTFEGAFEWTVHSQAYAENEWKGATPWNVPSAETLQPRQSRTFGLEFLVADQIPHIEAALAAANRPVAVGVPGYIVPTDLDAQLFLNPGTRKVTTLAVDPAQTLSVTPAASTKTGELHYVVRGVAWGRSRLTVHYDDGTVQAIHYDVTKPAQQAVADLGHFLTTKAWYTDTTDPFHRAPSVMNYDKAHDRIVLQDTRAWIAGLSDEGGAGAWLAAMMKEYAAPDPAEIQKLSEFVDHELWGVIQYSDGPRKYGVKKSVFFYQPDLLPTFVYAPGNWTTWTSWNKEQAEAVNRAYDYPHVVAAYWVMYQLARNHPGLVTSHPWDWYLDQAFNTVKFMTGGFAVPGEKGGVGYVNVGLMDGDIFVLLLDDLKREGRAEQATYLEGAMKARADRWNSEAYPFGSEMAWDSTGQEEIFAWTDFFGYHDKATVALDSILGYMPTLPHWGYNGNARRYWDFIYGAAPGGGIERQLHHYGSGINSVPVLTAYREHPENDYLLRIGYAGSMGALSSIDQQGFPSAAFHSYPQNLRWDDYIGDYGPNFYGHAVTTGTYILNHPEFGWIAFGGNLTNQGGWITVEPKDSMRRRVYLAPVALYLTLDRGTFARVAYNPTTKEVRMELAPTASPLATTALLRYTQPVHLAGVDGYGIVSVVSTGQPLPPSFQTERGGIVVPVARAGANGAGPTTTVQLVPVHVDR